MNWTDWKSGDWVPGWMIVGALCALDLLGLVHLTRQLFT